MHYNNLKTINTIDEQLSTVTKKFGFKKIYPKSIASYPTALKYYTDDKPELISFTNASGGISILHDDPTISLFDSRISREKVYYLTNTFAWQKDLENLKGGVENFCQPSIFADAEMIVMVYEFLDSLKLDDFKIEIGHTHFIEKLLNHKDFSKKMKTELNDAIHNKNIPKIKNIIDPLELSPENKKALMTLAKLFGDYEKTLETAKTLNIIALKPIIDYLENLQKYLEYYGLDMTNIRIDLSLTNKYSYYDGLLFKSYSQNFGKKILQGGRYKNKDNQGIGFGFNVKDLIGVIQMKKEKRNTMDYTVLINDSVEEKAINMISKLRKSGCSVNTIEEQLTSELIKNSESKYILEIKDGTINIIDNLANKVIKKNYNQFLDELTLVTVESIH
jgi:ATP phosphoribosyltransferase regulatory subunit